MTGVNWILLAIGLQTFLASLFVLQGLKRQHDAQKKAALKPVPISKR